MSLSPSDQDTPSSLLPSWPLIDFDNPLSCFLQEEVPLPPSFIGSKSASPSSSLTPPQLLSSPASMGASTAKVSKRKSRAVNKPPIRVLSADRATFRDMVQKLTGIPTSPSMHAGRLWPGASNPAGIFRPMAARPCLQNELMAGGAHQSMPTLDTSSAYLSRGICSGYNDVCKSRFNGQYEGNFDPCMQPATKLEMGGGTGSLDPSRGAMYEERAYNEGGVAMDMESLWRLRQASELESLLLGSNKLEDLLLQSSRMDHWFSPDLLHSPSPQVEIAHSA